LLQVSGLLRDQPIGGPSVDIAGDEPVPRRTVYAHIDRQNFPGLFRVFDVALPDTHAPKRFQTTVPQQALYLLNSPFALQCAERLAADTRGLANDRSERTAELYRRVLGRMPTAREVEQADAYLRAAEKDGDSEDAWRQLSQVLLVSNEFVFLD
jgi:hypothetical protein